MCGIFGYPNYLTERTKDEISDILINGLRRIEYRGYDSAGFCLRDDENKSYHLFRSVGKVEELNNLKKTQNLVSLSQKVKNHVAIAHTRWAPHGQPSVNNCHPLRSDEDGSFLVVHNGIITNYKTLRSFLERRNFKFESETDTECVAKLALHFYREALKKERPEFIKIVKKVIRNCDGAFAFVFVSPLFPNEMIAVRKSSPLLIGIKACNKMSIDFLNVNYGTTKDDEPCSPLQSPVMQEQYPPILDDLRRAVDACTVEAHNNNELEIFVASDASALIEHTKKVIFLEDNDIACISNGKFVIHRPNSREKEIGKDTREVITLESELAAIMKGNYEHYMLKEIYEHRDSVINTMRGRINFDNYTVCLGGLQDCKQSIYRSQRILFISCGTSYHASLANRALLEELLDIPVCIEVASDFLDRKSPVMRSDCAFFISQSGESADSVAALRYCLERGALCIGITNTVGSTVSRETKCGVHINCGPEIGVASTKVYTSQYIALVLIALQLSEHNLNLKKRREEIIDGLRDISKLITRTLEDSEKFKEYAMTLKDEKNMLIVGRGYQYATCLEGALKIKELTYLHSEGIVAGELKHGPIAQVDKDLQIVVVVANDEHFDRSHNAIQQICTRNGAPLIICTEDIASEYKDSKVITVPKTVDCLQGVVSIIQTVE